MNVFRVIFWIITLGFSLQVSAAEKTQPNVIVIMCDDLGYGDVGGFGRDNEVSYTPNIDLMASEGVKLTNFLVPMPYCAPSRASFLTGRYPYRTRIVYNPTPDQDINDYGLDPSEITIAEVLSEGGYETACVGKWHLGHKPHHLPINQGFDYYLGILYSNDMRPIQVVENDQVVEYPVVQGNLTKNYTEASIKFIKSSVKASKTFFLYLAHAMPHKPLAASEAFYTPKTPDNLYEDVIRELDWSVGSILDELKSLDIDKETLVIFMSDNGPWYGGDTGGLRGMKARSWEGGIRVPFIARWPGNILKNVVNPSLASSVDLFPMLVDLAGLDQPTERTIDGLSLWPLLSERSANSQHEFVISMHRNRLMTIHSGPWKYHFNAPDPPKKFGDLATWKDSRGPDGLTIIAPNEQSNPGQHPGATKGPNPSKGMLFNTLTDPGETIDVSKQHPELVEKLHKHAQAILKEMPELPIPKGTAEIKHIPGGRLDFWNNPISN